MTNKAYDILNFIAQVVLPLFATLYITVAEIWNLPFPKEISATIMAVDTLLGGILMKSNYNYNKDKLPPE